jgi:putative ABC transport system permease protein
MTLKDIAFRNLMRRKAKAAFVLAGLLIGISTVVGLISLVEAMTRDINHKLEKYGANILVVPKTENLSLTYGGLSLGGVSFEMEEIKEEELSRVKSITNAANVAALGPMALGVVQVGNHKVLLAGVDFEACEILKPWWKIDGTVPSENSVLLGAEAARVLEGHVGSSLDIKGRQFLVSGVLQPTGSQDDQLVFARLGTAQALLGKEGKISMAEVAALCKDCPINEMVRQISSVIPGAKVMAIQQVVKGRMETLAQFRKFSYGLSAVVVLVGGLVVLVTMMGSVRERTREIGVLRAIGFRRSHVVRVVFLEAGLISGLAGILGYLLGFLAAKGVLLVSADSQAVSVPWNIELAAGAFILAILIGLISSAYPALLAARLDPNEALRAL